MPFKGVDLKASFKTAKWVGVFIFHFKSRSRKNVKREQAQMNTAFDLPSVASDNAPHFT